MDFSATCYPFIDGVRVNEERHDGGSGRRIAETVGRRSAARTRSAGDLRTRNASEVTLLYTSIIPHTFGKTPCPTLHSTSTPDPLSVRHLFITLLKNTILHYLPNADLEQNELLFHSLKLFYYQNDLRRTTITDS